MHYEPRRMGEKIVTIFNMIKMRSKKLYFSNLTNKYKIDFKKTWQLIEKAFVKGQVSSFPKQDFCKQEKCYKHRVHYH